MNIYTVNVGCKVYGYYLFVFHYIFFYIKRVMNKKKNEIEVLLLIIFKINVKHAQVL